MVTVATRVWEYRHTPPLYAAFTGSAQRLSNGNTFISWGPLGVMTEVTPLGTTALEMTFPAGVSTYRAYKHELPAENKILTLTALIEGFYRNVTMIQDTATVYLRDDDFPFSVFDSSRAVLNSNGVGIFSFTNIHKNKFISWPA